MFSSVFKNEDVLNPEYLPEQLPHRGNEIKEIADLLLPISKGRRGINIFIHGPPGIGKTASIKYIFREFESFTGIKTIYINCWEFKTSISVLTEITISLGFFVQRRGWSKDEIFRRMIEALKKLNKGLVIALDEVDQLIYKDQSTLYDLLRINQYVNIPIAIVFISNDKHVFSRVEPRIRSSLSLMEIEFKPYSFLEMKDILKKRADLAFFDYEPALIALCANEAVKKGGDVRVGLECLLKAGRMAERENSKKVKVAHIKKIIAGIKEAKPRIIKERLEDVERKLLEIIKKKKPGTIKELYSLYKKGAKNALSERMIRNYLKHLKDIGFVDLEKQGRVIKITLKVTDF